MRLIKKGKFDYVCPDSVLVKKWNLDINFMEGNTVCLSLVGNDSLLYVNNNIHPNLRRKYICQKIDKIDDELFFDIRIWTEEKIITFWTNHTGNYLKKIRKIRDLIKDGDLINDIDDYHVIYESYDSNGETWIIDCMLRDIDAVIEDEYFDMLVENCHSRGHLVMPSLRREMLDDKEGRKRYKSCCKYWENKIGQLDVVQYHMLVYEE